MFTKALLPDTLRAIQLVASLPTVKRAYLAGGTALALQLGHRLSQDLDFFTQEEFDENILATSLLKIKAFKEDRRDWRTILGYISNTKFSIFYYPYKLIEKPLAFEGIRILRKKDIATMKLDAIGNRGTKRDFIDLFFLAKEFSLNQVFDFYEQKYGNLEEKMYHLIKGVSYFEDAETEKQPEMFIATEWDKVKEFFQQEAIRLAKEKLNIPGL